LNESLVPHAERFDPGRWLGTEGSTLKKLSMPFGAGPRMCPGRYLALVEMKMAMAMLLGRFDIRSVDTPDGKEAREWLSVTMGPLGLTMKLTERRSTS
jgi:cytochrome P450